MTCLKGERGEAGERKKAKAGGSKERGPMRVAGKRQLPRIRRDGWIDRKES